MNYTILVITHLFYSTMLGELTSIDLQHHFAREIIMKQKILALLVLLLFSQLGHAEEPIWFTEAIKVDNPNELAYWFTLEKECPLSKVEIQEIVEGVFIRSRIKPLKEAISEPGRIYLDLSVQCFKRMGNEEVLVYKINLFFSRWNPKPAVKFDSSFGGYGIIKKPRLLAVIKESVEEAITVYIKANFDL